MSEAENYAADGPGPIGGQEAPRSGPPPNPPPGTGWQHYPDPQRFDPRRKSPTMAAILSVVPGVGHLYIGYYVRGFFIAGAFLTIFLASASSRGPVGPVMAMFAVFVWAFNIIDAGRMAALYNHVAAGAETIELPEDFKVPRMGGSIAGGVVLLLFGGIALSNTAFGVRLDWLEDWWPVFPLALGGYLLARGVMDYMVHNQGSSTPYGFKDGGPAVED